MEVVDKELPEARRGALTHVRALVQQPEGPQYQVAGVERAAVVQQRVVVRVQPRELELPRPAAALRIGVLGQGVRLRGHLPVINHARLEPVDAGHESRQEGRRVAADLVVAEAELSDRVEQQRDAVGTAHDGEVGRVAGLRRLVAQQAFAERAEGAHVQLLVRWLHQALDRGAHRGCRSRRRGQREYRVGRRALPHQPGEALLEQMSLPGAGPAQHEQGAVRVGHHLGGHPPRIRPLAAGAEGGGVRRRHAPAHVAGCLEHHADSDLTELAA